MNTERLLALADVVEKSDTFNMAAGFWGKSWAGLGLLSRADHPCGTPACLVGHAEVMRLGRLPEPDDYHGGMGAYALAKVYLGLNFVQATELFQPKHYADETITGTQAANTIRRFVETGEIVW